MVRCLSVNLSPLVLELLCFGKDPLILVSHTLNLSFKLLIADKLLRSITPQLGKLCCFLSLLVIQFHISLL